MVTLLETGMVKDGFALSSQIDAVRQLFIGATIDFAFVPDDPWWLPLFGQTIQADDYPLLAEKFSLTGAVVLPDCRGRVVAGLDNMGGVSANRLTGQILNGINGDNMGAVGGLEAHALTIAQMPAHKHTSEFRKLFSHSHTIPLATGTSGSSLAFQRVSTTPSTSNFSTSSASDTEKSAVTVSDTGGGDAHNNVQPTIIMYKCMLAY